MDLRNYRKFKLDSEKDFRAKIVNKSIETCCDIFVLHL